MNIYRVPIIIAGSAYVLASSMIEAQRAVGMMSDMSIEVQEDETQEVPISGRRLDDPDLPDVSISPAMTVIGIEPESSPELVDTSAMPEVDDADELQAA